VVSADVRWNDWSVVDTVDSDEDPDRTVRGSDGGLGEGDPQVVVLSQIVVVELYEGLDGLLHRAHLDQSHLMVLPE